MAKQKIEAPEHLSETTRAWWVDVVTSWELEEHHLRLLTLAGEAWDRNVEARERLALDGSYITDRFNQLRAHPAIAIERDSRIAFARLVRELQLDADVTPDSRPPMLTAYKGR